jgi:chemotaxis protein methyltransferase CheR
MTDQDFDYIRRVLQERTAIVLEPGKQYLVESRLTPLVRAHKLNSIGELITCMRTHPERGLQAQLVEAMVTTETSFFRDHRSFDTLEKHVLPDLVRKRRPEKALRIWSAACSTGQEAYSLAIMLREHFPELAKWHVTILASDVSREVLSRAAQGRFNQVEVNRGMPAALLVRYFEQHGTSWQLRPDIVSMVKLQEINLALPWPSLPRFDLVLLRNVMIYFDVETKKSILVRIGKLLRPDGYLLLGGAETTINLDDSYCRVESLKSGFYQRVHG